MRFNVKKLFNVRWMLAGLGTMAGGLILHQVIQRYVPNVYGRWAASAAAALMGFWYPGTKMVLGVTHLDDDIQNFG